MMNPAAAAPGGGYGGGVNFAPVKPLQELAQSGTEKAHEHSSLHALIREIHHTIMNENVQERREIIETGRLMSNLRSGKLIMMRDPIYGGLALVKPLPRKPRSDRHIYPLAQVNSSQLTSIWTLSRPKVTPRHFGSNNRAQIQHALIEKVSDHYEAAMFDELFNQRESLSMMDYGTSGIRVYVDNRLNTLKQLKPIVEEADAVVFDGYGFCLACAGEGTDDDFQKYDPMRPQCPHCGSYNVTDIVPKQIARVPQVVGVEEIVQGDITAELLSIPAVNWDMRKFMHESPWVNIRTEVPLGFIRSIMGVDLPAGDPDDDFGLGVINALGTRGGAIEGYGRENLFGNTRNKPEVAIMDEDYLDVEFYAGKTLDRDEMTVSGQVIPKGVPLEEIFPDGICAIGFQEMDVLAGVWNEKKHIVSGVYHIQSFSGVGKGTSDAIETSEQLNIVHSAALAMIKRFGAGGGVWYDKEVMTKTEAQSLLKPNGLVGVAMRGTQYSSVQQAIGQIQHAELNTSNLTMISQLSNLINIAFQTTDFTSGVSDSRVDVNTLGGQQLLQAQNQQRSQAPLRMKGYTRAVVMEHVIELFRQHIKIPRFFGTNDRFALTRGRFLSGEDLPESIKFDFVRDSELPTNTYTKRENAERMLEKSQFFGVPFLEVAVAKPRLAAWWASQFRTEIPLYNQDEILLVCQERLDNLREITTMLEQAFELSQVYPDPAEIGNMAVDELQRKVTLSEENHVVKAEVLSEYLDDDEVIEWSDYMRAAVEALIHRHYTLDRDARFRQPALDIEGQTALGIQQQQLASAAMRPEMDRQRDQAIEEEGLARAADEVSADNQSEREERSKEKDFDRQQRGADRDLNRNIKLEGAKARYAKSKSKSK